MMLAGAAILDRSTHGGFPRLRKTAALFTEDEALTVNVCVCVTCYGIICGREKEGGCKSKGRKA